MEQLAQIDRAKRQEQMQVVLAQPHRRGNTDQRCATAFGRFTLRMGIRRELIQAADKYVDLKRRWLAAWGACAVDRPAERTGLGEGPSWETMRRWSAQITEGEHAMMDASAPGYFAIRLLLLEDAEIGIDQDAAAVISLKVLSVEYGLLKAHESPYGRA